VDIKDRVREALDRRAAGEDLEAVAESLIFGDEEEEVAEEEEVPTIVCFECGFETSEEEALLEHYLGEHEMEFENVEAMLEHYGIDVDELMTEPEEVEDKEPVDERFVKLNRVKMAKAARLRGRKLKTSAAARAGRRKAARKVSMGLAGKSKTARRRKKLARTARAGFMQLK
jgi:hypothetical protein